MRISHASPQPYEAGKYLPANLQTRPSPILDRRRRGLDGSGHKYASERISKRQPQARYLVRLGNFARGRGQRRILGIPVKPSTTYRVSFFAKAASGFTRPVTVSLESADGKTTYASAKVSGLKGEWKKFETTLKTNERAGLKRQPIQAHHDHTWHFWLQNVSLFPPPIRSARTATASTSWNCSRP